MGWKNSIKDELPQHNEEVLVSINGVNRIAYYDAIKKGFKVRESGKTIPINNKEAIIYWQKLADPA